MKTTLKEKISYINKLILGRQYDEALKVCNETILNYSDCYEGYQERSEVYFKMGVVDKAFDDLDKIIQLLPDNPSPHFRMGLWCLEKGMFTKAIAAFTQVIDIKDDYFFEAAHFYRAQANLMVKRYEAALADSENISEDYCMFMRINGSEYIPRTRKDIVAEALGKS